MSFIHFFGLKLILSHRYACAAELIESLEHVQPYTRMDEKGVRTTCGGYLANVEADSNQPPQMRKPAVRLQHAYEYLKFEPGKKMSIVMKAYCEGPIRRSAEILTSGLSLSSSMLSLLSNKPCFGVSLAPKTLAHRATFPRPGNSMLSKTTWLLRSCL